MSASNLELVRHGYEEFQNGRRSLTDDEATPDFVWDMSKFSGWMEQQSYEGVAGMEAFLSNWTESWEGWRLEVEELHDAGDRIVAVLRQHGRSKLTGMALDMPFAQVWTFRDGRRARMEMYSDVGEAMRAAGLAA